jgi:hypothetical protein
MATGHCFRPWRHPKSRRDPSTGDSPFSHGTRDPGYCDAIPRPLSVETRRYFEGKPGLSVNPGQMSEYQRKRDELGMFILREYPSTLEECFQSPVEGAIYAELIDKPLAHSDCSRGNQARDA